MKLEIGKKYKSRDGRVYTITSFNGSTYGYSSCPAMWYEGGYALCNRAPHPYDLIEEVRECNMEFLTQNGIATMGQVGPLRAGDRVMFSDASCACYSDSKGLLVGWSLVNKVSGTLIATNCKLPAINSAGNSVDVPNDAIVFTDCGKTYFTRLAFLKRA